MKHYILKTLKKNAGSYVSGEELGQGIGVTRTAIWKHVQELKAEGYAIESSSRKGYRLLNKCVDVVNSHEIAYKLDTKVIGKEVLFFPKIDSTNNYARKIALEGCIEGTVVIADSQTSGKGRLGRTWVSADKKGIWMSIVLRPQLPPEDMQVITLAASTAVVSAIEGETGIVAGIKWPNDVILDSRKVCGILTELSCEMEAVNFIILGIGVNVNHDSKDFPDEFRDKAISLKIYAENYGIGREIMSPDGFFNRCRLVRRILSEMEMRYEKILHSRAEEIIEEWRQHSIMLGREVQYSLRGVCHTGIAEDITKDGKLIVRLKDGGIHELLSGEVTVRGMMGQA